MFVRDLPSDIEIQRCWAIVKKGEASRIAMGTGIVELVRPKVMIKKGKKYLIGEVNGVKMSFGPGTVISFSGSKGSEPLFEKRILRDFQKWRR